MGVGSPVAGGGEGDASGEGDGAGAGWWCSWPATSREAKATMNVTMVRATTQGPIRLIDPSYRDVMRSAVSLTDRSILRRLRVRAGSTAGALLR